MERKVTKWGLHKIRGRKVKTLTRNWRDHCRIGTRKHTETVSSYFDRHSRLYQSKESKCLWTHDKDGITREFMKDATRGLREGWMERNYLRLNSTKFTQIQEAIFPILSCFWLCSLVTGHSTYWPNRFQNIKIHKILILFNEQHQENVPEYEWILWSFDVYSDSIYNLRI